MFVVDASITMAWCFGDESEAAADAALDLLLQDGAIAPAHWPLEVANALRSAERRGRIAPADVVVLRTLLTSLPVEVVPVELSTALGVIETARAHELSVYDATYLDLALIRGVGLATVDVRLALACRAAGVPLLT
jgi:predicted nucleic acid-binding protein